MKPQKNHSSSKYFIVFVTAFLCCCLTQEILLNRLVSIGIGAAYITGGALICLTASLIIDIVTEVYGYKLARQMLWCGLLAPLFMALLITLCLKMPYPPFWSSMTAAYQLALGSIGRVAIISFFALFMAQFINAYLISKWRVIAQGKYFWLRSLGASVIGEGIAVMSSILLIFVGRAPLHMIIVNIITNMSVGILYTAIGAIPASFIAKITAKAEGLNNYDVGVSFNPFAQNIES